MLTLKKKQQQVIELANDPTVSTIVLIGSVGTGKTDVAAHLSLSLAYQFPKTFWPVFRQNTSTAKRSVIPSYLNMADMMNLVEGEDYSFNRAESVLTLKHNNSVIPFIEADITKDRQGRKIKGINATGNHIDEADELHQTMYITATSRRGRRNTNHQPSLSIVTMNPNDTHLKALYYDPWKAGTLPSDTRVIEFTIADSWQSQADIDAMMRNPRPWVERYLRNNWNYQDDQDSLFKYRHFDAALVLVSDKNARRYIGYDVARSGSDRSVCALWYGNTLVDIVIIKASDEQMTTDEQALWLIKYMTQNAVTADCIDVDGVGLGVGVIDHMHSKGIDVHSFVSGSSPTSPTYDNLRSEVIYHLARGLEKGTIQIAHSCAYRNELISEAMMHNHKNDGKKLAVESKDKIKERTGGMSPDIFDAVVMGLHQQLEGDYNGILL